MKTSHVILVIVLAVAAGFFTGYRCKPICSEGKVDRDTVYITDSVTKYKPVPIFETSFESIPEPFPVYFTTAGDTIHDTIYVSIERTRREYKTEDYHLAITGYEPDLEFITVYRHDRTITNTVKPRRFGVGVIGGYGIGRHGLSPYVGLGAFYRIW